MCVVCARACACVWALYGLELTQPTQCVVMASSGALVLSAIKALDAQTGKTTEEPSFHSRGAVKRACEELLSHLPARAVNQCLRLLVDAGLLLKDKERYGGVSE
jgi:hypothetical protein